MQRDRSSVDEAATGVRVGHKCGPRHTQSFDQAFVGKEEESLVACDGPAKCRPKLVSFKWRNRFVLGIEKVLRIEGRIPYELEGRSMNRIFTGTRHRVDLSAGRSAEFGGIGVCQNLEF